MAAHIRTGKSNGSRRGFTIIELMVVMTIISILMSLAIPAYQKAILRSKESVLRNNLFTMRTIIDEYTYDKQKAPQTLQDLVSEGTCAQSQGSDDGFRFELEGDHGRCG